MIKDSTKWMQVFDKIRQTYFENWHNSESLEEREVVFRKMGVIKDIEQELDALRIQQLRELQ